MTDIKDILRPISNNHSIKEAVITLFLATPIIKPERFETLIKNFFKDKFQRFERINQVQFQVKSKEGGSIENPIPEIQENIGFRFQRFEEGKIVTAVQGVNEILRNFISYHSLNYSDWDVFFPAFKETLTDISTFHSNLFVNAFSLHYIDEFIWELDGDINTNKIFNENSILLPKEFFNCKLNNYQLTTIKEDTFEYFDRLEIKVEERPKKVITISHNVIHNMNDNVPLNDLIVSKELQDMLNHAHFLNKKALVSLLTNDVCKLIDIKL